MTRFNNKSVRAILNDKTQRFNLLAQQIRAVLNQRLIKTLCHGCRVMRPAKDFLPGEDIEKLDLKPEDVIGSHNPGGCDLCNRTGILGRALLLEALLVNTPTAKRDPIFHALVHNVNDIAHQEGVIHMPRKRAVFGLVKDGLIDPKIALAMIDE